MKKTSLSKFILFAFVLVVFALPQLVNADQNVTEPKAQIGFNIGDDYTLITYTQLTKYWKTLDKESPRMKLVEIGRTAEDRPQWMAIITSPENHKKLDRYKDISARLALAKGLNDEDARKLAVEGKAVVWIDGGLHATEVVGSHQLMEIVYQMVSRDDRETMRFLDDVIILAVHANPDGMELVSDWYMKDSDPKKRSTRSLPRLYQKYVGHDNNRDSYMATQPETINMNKIMYREWYPQIMYNHHQTGPSGLVVFVPPFRDPPNYNFDPLLIIGIEQVGAAMHSRLIAEGKPGSGMRNVSSYSTWFNGNVRTTGYFHNQIGILTEIKGNPTPVELNIVPDRMLKSMDSPFPISPKTFHFSEAIEYSITMDKAIIDLASRYRETFLYNRYIMGRNSIERGSQDNWTIHPKIVDAVKAEVSQASPSNQQAASRFGGRSRGITKKQFELFRKPENRDPRGFILPSDQSDFPTATKFVNTLIKNGVVVHQASRGFEVAGKNYPAGSYIVKAAQAFRPHVMDMFEPQDHPNDFMYEGGPPRPPYDNAGYTLAFQMGIEFDRILEGFEGPFQEINGLAKPLTGKVNNARGAIGFFLDHAFNDSSVVTNRLLADSNKVYWLKKSYVLNDKTFPVGTIYIEARSSTLKKLEGMSKELGVSFYGTPSVPNVSALQINPVRIGLWDRYGGSMPSGWTRWLLEQYEFPFEVVYPPKLDEGNLKSQFDVLIFVSGAIPAPRNSRASQFGGRGFGGTPNLDNIPAEYHHMVGNITPDKTIPKLLEFLNEGGTVITIGSSTALAQHAGVPVGNHMVDQNGNSLGRDVYFVPSSILEVRVNNQHPLAYGLDDRIDVFFSNSRVMRPQVEADKKGFTSIAWFDSDKPLRSGWAWGQDQLYGGVAVAEAKVGKGQLFLFGPEVLFRAQPHGTFNFVFNGIYLGGAKPVTLK
ncbi:MAG: M14 metallopeptidase family protein [Candidatus Aminicenantaceae bacterium]